MNKTDSRTVKTARNIGANIASRAVVSVLKLVSRVVFARLLGTQLLGVNGIFSDVLGMLTLAELGIGTAIHFNLYRPLAEKNEAKIRSLMRFYRSAYRVIAAAVLLLGAALLPALPYLIREHASIPYFYGIYGIFLFNLAAEYSFTYKRTLASAAQEGYVIVPYTAAFEGAICALQIGTVFFFRESPYCYLAYLGVQSAALLLEYLVINKMLDRRYPALRDLSRAEPLPREEKSAVWQKVRALLFHKIGDYTVARTDTLVISAIISVETVARYQNYSTLLLTVDAVAYLFVGSTISSFGDLFVSEAPERRREVFEEMLVFDYFLYGVGTAFFITLFTPFITLAYGAEHLIHMGTVILVVGTNFFLLGIIHVIDAAKAAAGLYREDRYVPLLQAVINLAVSIVLAKTIGLAGVFIGTLVSAILPFFVKPALLYRSVFDSSPRRFFLRFFAEAALAAASAAAAWGLCRLWQPENLVLRLLYDFVLTAAVAVGAFLLAHCRDARLKRLLARGKKLLGRKMP